MKDFESFGFTNKRRIDALLSIEGLFYTECITDEEYTRLKEMINSSDEENLYMAEQIIQIKWKI